MEILIGMDEAGYGPQLGPLVVAATAWQVTDEVSGVAWQVLDQTDPADAPAGEPAGEPASAGGGSARVALLNPRSEVRNPKSQINLYRLLHRAVSKAACNRRIAITDSKALYHPGHGLRQLERGIHAVLRSLDQTPACWSALVDYCRADPDNHHQRACWPNEFACPLPVDAADDELDQLRALLTHACETAGVRPLAIRALLVFPAQFNDLVAYHNSKGTALSHITIGLLRDLMDSVLASLPTSAFPLPPSIHAVCDKHGGRNFYAAILQHHFPDFWIAPVVESSAESRYEWGPPEARARVDFCTNGERFLPTALASMTAKYLRELAMRAFNAFWTAHVPGLRPTAGYGNDSHRFKNAIAAKQRELGIEDHLLWRNR